MNKTIVFLIVVLGVSMFLNVGFYRCNHLWEDCAATYQTRAEQDYKDMQTLLKLHGDEVMLRLEAQDKLEDAEENILEILGKYNELVDALEAANTDLRWAVAKKNEAVEELAEQDAAMETLLKLHEEAVNSNLFLDAFLEEKDELIDGLVSICNELEEKLDLVTRQRDMFQTSSVNTIIGLEWLQDKATWKQVRRWRDGDWTEWVDYVEAYPDTLYYGD